MNSFDIGVIAFFLLSGIVMSVYYLKSKKPLRNAFIGAASGICTLAAAKVASLFLGFSVSFSLFTVITSAVLGIPGALCTIILNAMLGVG